MDVTKQLNIADLYSAKDLVIVITGGATGIGLAFASALSQTSAKKIYILGRRLEKAQEAAELLDASGDRVVAIQCDVTDQASVASAAKRVEDECGYLDVLINNSGVLGPDHEGIYGAQSIADLQKVMLGDWDKWAPTFATKVSAVAGVSAHFLHLLDNGNKRKGWKTGRMQAGEIRERRVEHGVDEDDKRTSQIITTTSVASFNRHMTAGMAYAASKAGATLLCKAMATFLAPFGIRSNFIAPGIYPSAMTIGRPATFPWDQIPAGRQGTFEDMSASLLHLVGRGGAFLNGLVMLTDGGRLSVMESTY